MPVDFDDALRDFCLKLEVDGRSPKTLSAYRRDLLMVGRALGAGPLDAAMVTPGMLDSALASPGVACTTKGEPRSAASLHRVKAALRSFFSWMHDDGRIPSNPARKIVMKRLPRKPPVFLTEKEKARLLKELRDRGSSLSLRDRVIIEMFLGTGIRLQEMVELDIGDVDLDAKHLHIRAKGNVFQIKFLKTDLRQLLKRYMKERAKLSPKDGSSALFLSQLDKRLSARQVGFRLEAWLLKAGIYKQVTPHSLRHTFATHLYAKTTNLLVVKRALGHRDIATTEIYTHLVDDELEESLEKL